MLLSESVVTTKPEHTIEWIFIKYFLIFKIDFPFKRCIYAFHFSRFDRSNLCNSFNIVADNVCYWHEYCMRVQLLYPSRRSHAFPCIYSYYPSASLCAPFFSVSPWHCLCLDYGEICNMLHCMSIVHVSFHSKSFLFHWCHKNHCKRGKS